MTALPNPPLVSGAVPGHVVARPAHASRARNSAAAPRGVLAMPIRDLKADWKRWSRAERISAVAIVAAVIFAYGLSLVETLAG
jgi:hypothetical protein